MLRLVTDDEHATPSGKLAAQVRALADQIERGLNVKYGVIVAMVDGSVNYAPLGEITLLEATGLLELVSRRFERDLTQ